MIQSEREVVESGRVAQRVPPPWLDDLHTLYLGRIAREFILHFNLTDLIVDLDGRRDLGRGLYERRGSVVPPPTGTLLTLRDYLRAFLFTSLGCDAVYTYSLADGLSAEDAPRPGQQSGGGAWLRFRQAVETLGLAPARGGAGRGTGRPEQLPDGLPDTLKLLGHLLRREPPIAVVLDYAEKLIPYDLEEGRGDREQLQAMEVFQRWALDPAIRRSSNVILLLTGNLGQVPKSLHAEGSGCRTIRVPLPTQAEREAFIRFKRTRDSREFAELAPADFGAGLDEQVHRLARATQGMRLIDIDNVSRRVMVEQGKPDGPGGRLDLSRGVLRGEDVQRAKGDVIEAQSAGLLEVVPPVRGFDHIGGLETVKRYLKERTKHMLSGRHSPLVPSGLLLAGPPGTGKTIIAEALANESKFNLVKMRRIQDRWVGSSERNLEMVLELLDDLHPVVVFVDEVDQAMGRRDTGQSLDSGVGARMFGRILEAMSSPDSRGKILWVAATNRADLLDDALLRRFDRVIPLLTPDVDESCHIFAAMPRTIASHSGQDMALSYGGDLAPPAAPAGPSPFQGVATRTAELGLTGAGIEIVVRRAIELAYEEAVAHAEADGGREPSLPTIHSRHLLGALDDFKTNHSRDSYDYQSLLAIRACNFRSVIPELPDRPPYSEVKAPDGLIDPEALNREIARIEEGRRR